MATETSSDERLRPHPEVRFASSQVDVDLNTVIKQLRAEPKAGERGHRQQTLYKNGGLTIALFVFDRFTGLPEHRAQGVVNIHVLRGRIKITIDGQVHELTGGQMVAMAPGMKHAVDAEEESEMLVTVRLSEDGSRSVPAASPPQSASSSQNEKSTGTAKATESEEPQRLNYGKVAPEAMHAMRGLEQYVRQSGLEKSLLELIKFRASQINGCAYCLDMHSKDARAGGETEQRLYALSAWDETPFYTERERAALAWTEAVTQVSQDHVPHDVYQRALRSFSEKELVDLTIAVIAINGWNRLAIPFRTTPGTYQVPGKH